LGPDADEDAMHSDSRCSLPGGRRWRPRGGRLHALGWKPGTDLGAGALRASDGDFAAGGRGVGTEVARPRARRSVQEPGGAAGGRGGRRAGSRGEGAKQREYRQLRDAVRWGGTSSRGTAPPRSVEEVQATVDALPGRSRPCPAPGLEPSGAAVGGGGHAPCLPADTTRRPARHGLQPSGPAGATTRRPARRGGESSATRPTPR
jgi:hypothetical protein